MQDIHSILGIATPDKVSFLELFRYLMYFYASGNPRYPWKVMATLDILLYMYISE